uniref:Cytochrome P450 n=2 Tax=Stomoxys calcitrans TaxID=35570 RepID=A0A1I8PDX4_STOCA
MHLILIVVAFVIAVGVAIKSHGSKKYMRSVIANIPGPHCIPILGCLYDVYKLNQKDFFKRMEDFIGKYGRVIRMWGFNRLAIMSADIELNEQLLISNDHITKNRNYETLHQWLGKGLLISNGKKWHARRKIITPTFHFKILEQFVDVFERQSSLVLEILKERADGKTVFDIYPFMCLLTLDIIAESAMGTKVNAQSGQAIPYTSAVREMTIMMAWRFQQLHLHNEILFSILQPIKKMRQTKLIQIMHQFTRNVIAKRREELKNNKRNTNAAYNEDNTYSEIGAKRRMALLDVLLQATVNGEPLTDEDIREEVDTFMFEGHDT